MLMVQHVLTYLMSNIGHLLICKVSWSSAVPLLHLPAWGSELCVLEEPPLNHNSLGRCRAHYQIAGSTGDRRHTHWMSCFTGRPGTTTKKHEYHYLMEILDTLLFLPRVINIYNYNTQACQICWGLLIDLDVVRESPQTH